MKVIKLIGAQRYHYNGRLYLGTKLYRVSDELADDLLEKVNDRDVPYFRIALKSELGAQTTTTGASASKKKRSKKKSSKKNDSTKVEDVTDAAPEGNDDTPDDGVTELDNPDATDADDSTVDVTGDDDSSDEGVQV